MKKNIFNNPLTISRRSAITYLIASLPLYLSFPKVKRIQWQGILSLPKPMAWNTCYSYLKKIMNLKNLIELESKMMAYKTMLYKQISLNKKKDKVKFTFIFKTNKDYQYWSKKSRQYLNEKYINKTNYHTKVNTLLL